MERRDGDERQAASFAIALESETARVLADPLFQRSPVQSKLLQFLCDKAKTGDNDLTQYTVAVDGLGRSEDYDLLADSYPRVQASRLRSNLANYYARRQAGNGLCLFIRPGEYRLRLLDQDRAYPTERINPAPMQHDTPAAILSEPGFAAAPPPPVPEPVRPDPVVDETPTEHPLPVQSRHRPQRRVVAAIAGIALLVLILFAVWRVWPVSDDLGPPVVQLTINSDSEFDTNPDLVGISSSVARLAQTRLSQSLVSTTPAGGPASPAGYAYTLSIDMGMGMEAPDAKITLTSSDQTVLYSDTTAFSGDRDSFLRKISSSLVYVIAPNGVIAREEIREIGKTARSPYQCFIGIEGNRAAGAETTREVDSCLKQFPGHRYSAFWLARKAFDQYRRDVTAGKPVQRSSPAWNYVEQALAVDINNPFANFIAAKVSLAEGNCDTAKVFADRALETGVSYPAMLAHAEAEGSGCSSDDTLRKDVVALVENNPAPDPVLQLYLVLASLSIDRKDMAKIAANRLVIDKAGGQLEMASAQLTKAVNDPAYFARNRADIEQIVAVFIWNREARRRILTTIAQ